MTIRMLDSFPLKLYKRYDRTNSYIVFFSDWTLFSKTKKNRKKNQEIHSHYVRLVKDWMTYIRIFS